MTVLEMLRSSAGVRCQGVSLSMTCNGNNPDEWLVRVMQFNQRLLASQNAVLNQDLLIFLKEE
jgi:hypothetical protein